MNIFLVDEGEWAPSFRTETATVAAFASAIPYRHPLRFRRTLPPPLSTYSGMNKVTDGYLNKISLIMAQVEKAIFFV